MMRKSSIIFLLGIFCLVGLPESLPAQSQSHTVQKGETLFSISQKYGIEVEQLKQWNDLSGSQLSIGQTLAVKKQKNPAGKQPHSGKNHTVTKGETLFSISQKYGISVDELKSWNNLSTNNLPRGQTLRVTSPGSADEPPQAKNAKRSGNTRQSNYYIVKNGDSLYGIARKHGMEVPKLKRMNNLSSATIRVGQKLVVSGSATTPSGSKAAAPAAQGKFMKYTVTGGNMTVPDLVKKFQMDEEEFRALNPGADSSELQNGREVTVLAPPSRKFKNPYAKSSRSMNSLGTITVSPYTGKPTASPTTSGELYNPEALTGAHPNIALGSVIFVKSPVFPHGVFVRINDRISGNELKLSTAAWKALHLSGSRAQATIYKSK